ncbi:MAG: response regulator [Alphaproteobacteria bacterium]|nr:MAG: response regulator [Alphaproteobacteria bacterium]
MLMAGSDRKTGFLSLSGSINEHMPEWQIASIRLPGSGPEDMKALAQKILGLYADKEGILFPFDDKAVLLTRYGSLGDSVAFKSELEQKLAGRGYTFMVRQMSAEALKQVEENFVDGDGSADTLFKDRLKRPENRILVVDDDFFYRALMQKECEGYAKMHQSEDGKNAVELYREINPDIVFLDIHLPSAPGLAILEQLSNVDFDAFIIMMSSDTSKHNVLQAVKKGASGVLKKPPESGKLLRIFRACPTFKKSPLQQEAAKA